MVSRALLLFCQVLGISELRLLVGVCLKGYTPQHFFDPCKLCASLPQKRTQEAA